MSVQYNRDAASKEVSLHPLGMMATPIILPLPIVLHIVPGRMREFVRAVCCFVVASCEAQDAELELELH